MVAGVLHAISSRITRIVRELLKARPNSTSPTAGDGSYLATGRDPMASTTVFYPPVLGEVMDVAHNQSTGEQGRPVRQGMYGVTDGNYLGALLAKEPRENDDGEDKEKQGEEAQSMLVLTQFQLSGQRPRKP